jgi:hypothetical protein
MKIKLKELSDIIDHLRYNLSIPIESDIEVSITNEDIQSDVLQAALSISVSTTKEQKYGNYKEPKTSTHTIEIFPSNENRDPQLTTAEMQVLKRSKD